MPSDKLAYEAGLGCAETNVPYLLRKWQLTNTRYLLGPAGYLSALNQELDSVLHRFRILAPFKLAPKPGVENINSLAEITAEEAPDGGLAVFDFTGALPRAKLYSNWRVSTNSPAALQQWLNTAQQRLPREWSDALARVSPTDQATLKELGSASFDPEQTVLLASPPPGPAASSTDTTNQSPGTVEFKDYAPKDIHLHVNANAASVLLLNDKYDPNWKVYVDDKPSALLRCNFIMQGVQVPQGDHVIEFRLEVSRTPLYISLSAIGIGLLLIGFLTLGTRREKSSWPEVQIKNQAAPISNRKK